MATISKSSIRFSFASQACYSRKVSRRDRGEVLRGVLRGDLVLARVIWRQLFLESWFVECSRLPLRKAPLRIEFVEVLLPFFLTHSTIIKRIIGAGYSAGSFFIFKDG